MGTWNAGLYGNDTTCDIKDDYIELLKEQNSNEEAYRKIYEMYKEDEVIGSDEEALFWYALADTQWNTGRLQDDVKEKALKWIEKEGAIECWEEIRNGREKWEKAMLKLKEKLNTPMPPEKKFRKPKEFITNPFEIGDVYAYQFWSEDAEKLGLCGKYILFQKIGNRESRNNGKVRINSVIKVFDKVFDELPEDVSAIEGVRLLPSFEFQKEREQKYNFELFPIEESLNLDMILDKKNDLPVKHLHYIGKIEKSEPDYFERYGVGDKFWMKNMDDYFGSIHLSWQGVDYWELAGSK